MCNVMHKSIKWACKCTFKTLCLVLRGLTHSTHLVQTTNCTCIHCCSDCPRLRRRRCTPHRFSSRTVSHRSTHALHRRLPPLTVGPCLARARLKAPIGFLRLQRRFAHVHMPWRLGPLVQARQIRSASLPSRCQECRSNSLGPFGCKQVVHSLTLHL